MAGGLWIPLACDGPDQASERQRYLAALKALEKQPEDAVPPIRKCLFDPLGGK